jgi:type I restriction enzyme M protein
MSQFKLNSQVDNNKVFLVNRSELEGRLDTVFYKPLYVKNEESIKKSKWGYEKISNLAQRIVDGPFGSDLKADEYQPSGIPLLRVSNIKTGEVDGNIVFISDMKQQHLKRSAVFPGDVLLTKAGAILGYSAVFPEHLKEGNITSHLVTITCKQTINPHYLSHYFRCNIGQLQIYRWGNKSTRPELNTSEVKNILVTFPPLNVQCQIVDKMEAAYKARQGKEQQAQALLAGIDTYLLAELGISLLQQGTTKNASFLVMHSEIEGRLDPHQFHFERVNTIKAIGINNQLVKLHQLVKNVKKITTQIDENDVYIGLENIISNTGKYIATSDKQSISSASLFKKGHILFPKLRPYLNKVYLAEFNGICSTEFHVFEAFDFNVEFLAILLRSILVVNQTKHLMTGNTLPRLQTEDINNLILPLVPIQKQNEIVKHVSHIRSQAQQLQTEAAQILADAKAEVEHMILGE